MKIRIQGNSIRFRLKQSEVKQFREKGEIQEEISFGVLPQDKLSFVLKAGRTDRYKISFTSYVVLLEVPPITCAKWTNSNLVGFEEAVATDDGAIINVLVEKDFKCLDGSDVDNYDAFPNPNQYC